eukprot:CAMPEP_0206385802 /NCGR_PEP_ID=MMETSP0294-20121207/15511_1 /ASSEMBLY_ACC=CAM_ASM_000327 /TAXON_ID=39354 /ORGANISM="Heterosigma akashiwo, Strain CCMP2393" /LENGTH=170 /DNA_ID=CAMNT_0053836621 /DNA_START=190 /DNA_END=699 /DNA_ORIENTATION=-
MELANNVAEMARFSEYSTPELRQTCDRCLKMKKKCDKTKPQCWYCVSKGSPCHYSLRQKSGRKKKRPTQDCEEEIFGGQALRKKQERSTVEGNNAMEQQLVVRAPSYVSPLIGQQTPGFGTQESSYLSIFSNVFQNQLPAVADQSRLCRLLTEGATPPHGGPSSAGAAAE